MKKFKKIWRKLTIEEKTDILIDQFNISESDIRRIRNLKDGKARLLQAAKLQFEAFGNIHTDLTAWLAGYKSDVSVRQKFGSSLALRRKFIQFKNNFSEIAPSWNDIRNNVKLPNEINSDVAEETGIHIGDGYLNCIKDKRGGWGYRYSIDGNLIDEYLYHDQFIKPLIKKIYNCNGYKSINKVKNSVQSNFRSKLIFYYKAKILGLSIGNKINIEIPKIIFEDDEFAKKCLVGIFDTDFTLSRGVSFIGGLTSLRVIKQIHELLVRLKIKHRFRIGGGNFGRIAISTEDTIRILDEWGFHNLKHKSKFLIWKEYNKFVPFTYTEERIAVLENKLCIEELIIISNKRKEAKNRPPTPSTRILTSQSY